MESAEELIIRLIGQEAYDQMMRFIGMQEQAEANLIRFNELTSKLGGGSTFRDMAEAQAAVNKSQAEGAIALKQYNESFRQANTVIEQGIAFKQSFNGASRETINVVLQLARVQTEQSKQALNNSKIETEQLRQKLLQMKINADQEAKAFEATKAMRAEEEKLKKRQQADEAELTRLIQLEAKERAAADEKELAMLLEKEAAGKRYIAMYTELLAAEEAAAARGGTTIQKRNASLFPQAPLTGKAGTAPAQPAYDRYSAAGVTNEERAALQAKAAALDGVTSASNRTATAERQLITYTVEEIALLKAQGVVLREGTYILKESAGATESNAFAQKLFSDAQSTSRKETESASSSILNSTKGLRGFWGILRQVAYILPGIGIAGIFNLGFEAIEKVWQSLSKTNDKVREFTYDEKEAATTAQSVAEAYGKEAASLEITKKKIEDVNVPMHARMQAVKDIQQQFPDYFGNLTKEQILVGKVGEAYQRATDALLAHSRLQIYGEKLAKVDESLVLAEDRINSVEDFDRKYVGLYKDEKGYYNSTTDFAYTHGNGNVRGNKLIASGELDKDGKPIWTTLLDQVHKYNEALTEHNALLEKVAAVTPKASANVAHKEDAKKTPHDFSIATGNALAAGDAEQFEAQKNLRLADAALQKQIADDEKRTLDERIEAYRQYYNDVNAAALLDYAKERNIVQRKLEANTEALSKTKDAGKREKLEADQRTLNNRLLTIDTEYTVKKNKLDADRLDFTQKAEEKASEQNYQAILEGLKKIEATYQDAYDAEKGALDEKHTAGTISEKQYREGLLKLNREYAAKILQAEIDNLKELRDSGIFNGDPVGLQKTIDKIAELQKKLSEKPSSKAGKGVLGLSDEDLRLFGEIQTETELYLQTTQNLSKIFDAASQKRINGWNAEIEAIEKAKQSDIDLVNQSIGNADQKARAIAVINSRAAQQELNIQQKVKDEQRKQAVRDKEITLAQIAIKTALAVVNQLSQGDPYSAIPRSIAVGILGAVEFAAAAAQPIPAYRLGVKDHPGGPAIVGDGGVHEVAELPGGEFRLTPNVPTRVDLPVHTTVHKSIEDFISDMQRRTLNVKGMGVLRHVDERLNTQALESALDRQTAAIVNAVKGVPQPGFSITGAGIRTFVSNGYNQTEYLQNI